MPRRGVLPVFRQPDFGFAVFYIESHVIFAITWEVVVIPFVRKEERFRESTELTTGVRFKSCLHEKTEQTQARVQAPFNIIFPLT